MKIIVKVMVYTDVLELCVRWVSGIVAACGHPVLSVFYLVATFFRCSVLRVFYGFEFLGLMLVIIYMGAIAVLFLFVVIMLEMKVFGNVSDYTGFVSSYSIVFSVALLAYWLYISIVSYGTLIPVSETLEIINSGYTLTPKDHMDNVAGTAVLAALLYNHFWHLYLIAGVVLLVALIGASVLTRQSENFSGGNA